MTVPASSRWPSKRFPQERPYRYRPLAGELDDNRWSESTRESILKNYDTKTMFI